MDRYKKINFEGTDWVYYTYTQCIIHSEIIIDRLNELTNENKLLKKRLIEKDITLSKTLKVSENLQKKIEELEG